MKTIDTGTDQLLASVENRVATITLNRPEKRNALSDELTPALRQTLLVVEADPEVNCVVITGAGTAFCAGGDVSGMGSGRSDDSDARQPSSEERIRELQHRQETLTLRLFELSKPTIASLPGPAAGAGFSIALACDLRIASQSAFVTTAFGNIGLSGDYGASWLLPRAVGLAKAKELFFTSRRVGAEEGLTLGLFNTVVKDDEIREQTRELAETIAQGPPIAHRFMKQNLNRSQEADLKTCLALEADRLVRSAQTADHKEAVAAFLEKRKPRFEGL